MRKTSAIFLTLSVSVSSSRRRSRRRIVTQERNRRCDHTNPGGSSGGGRIDIGTRRVTPGFLAAARRLRVAAAFLPAARRFLVTAAFRPAARRFRLTAALRPAALRFLLRAAFERLSIRLCSFQCCRRYAESLIQIFRQGESHARRLSGLCQRLFSLVPKLQFGNAIAEATPVAFARLHHRPCPAKKVLRHLRSPAGIGNHDRNSARTLGCFFIPPPSSLIIPPCLCPSALILPPSAFFLMPRSRPRHDPSPERSRFPAECLLLRGISSHRHFFLDSSRVFETMRA